MKQDLVEISIGDKIYVKEGELQGAIGQIMNFDDNGNQVIFKPTNLDGFDDTLGMNKSLVVKYFETGDCVKIVDGRYIGETAIVVKVDEDVSMPMIRLDDTNRELHLNTCHLKMMNDKEKDDFKLVKKKAGYKNLNPIENKDSDVLYKVGDLIMFDYEKKMVQGYVIEAQNHQVRVVMESGGITNVPSIKINKKVVVDLRKAICRDSMGNPVQVDNVVKVNHGQYRGQKGIIRNMTAKNVLFLWDVKFMHRSAGIFVEQSKNVTIRGHEFIANRAAEAHQKGNMNRIGIHDLVGKVVSIISGEFKGQSGRVTHVNGQLAEIEMSIRAKKVFIDLSHLLVVNESDNQQASRNNDGDGGATMYRGGQTAYEAGKTPMP